MKNKIINTIFIFCIFIFLLAGLFRAIFLPKEMNAYENRYAYKFAAPTLENLLDGSFQSTAENALSDQVFFSQRMKKTYNDVNAGYTRPILSMITNKNNKNQYVNLGEVSLFGENLVYNTSSFEIIGSSLEKKVEELNDIFDRYENTEFYVYYIEKDTDINFETGQKVGVYEFLDNKLNLPGENIARFKTDSFAEFSENFYKTDHHWNADGSYKGYCQLLELLKITDKEIVPEGSEILPEIFQGSKTKTQKTASYSEEFKVNRYSFPKTKVKINGADVEDYGQQENYKFGKAENSNYALYYGDDMGEIIFDTGNKDKENILLIGESYDNAVLKLLASHFNKTYSIDLRFYTAYMGKTFHLKDYLKENNIQKVLLIGNIDYFVSSEFTPED